MNINSEQLKQYIQQHQQTAADHLEELDEYDNVRGEEVAVIDTCDLVLRMIEKLEPTPPKWDHAYSIGFSLKTDHEGDQVTTEELITALQGRIEDLRANGDEVLEACELFDTCENQ